VYQSRVEHKLVNALGDIPKAQQAVVEPELKASFHQDGREKAADLIWAAFRDKYATIYSSAVECLKRDGRACLAFYTFPATHWKTIRTSNVI
jgi:putative transposase